VEVDVVFHSAQSEHPALRPGEKIRTRYPSSLHPKGEREPGLGDESAAQGDPCADLRLGSFVTNPRSIKPIQMQPTYGRARKTQGLHCQVRQTLATLLHSFATWSFQQPRGRLKRPQEIPHPVPHFPDMRRPITSRPVTLWIEAQYSGHGAVVIDRPGITNPQESKKILERERKISQVGLHVGLDYLQKRHFVVRGKTLHFAKAHDFPINYCQ
jgi:hypothetical protein